jgi:peptidoglycan/LPS O-acetylase OafA/YrhL
MQNALLPSLNKNHRKDIIGLRAIAIVTIILYHIGILPETSTGSNCFLVISGYLITKSLFFSLENKTFSLRRFYLSRIKKLFPLTLITTFVALIIGCVVMLPNDLENLGASAIATSLFSNNILESIISHSYWAPNNAYKPLMHTWFLGVIFQIYLIYPILFIFTRKSLKNLLVLLILITTISLYLYLTTSEWGGATYYYLHYRIWEFAIGGIAAIISTSFNSLTIKSPWLRIFLLSLLIINICLTSYFIYYKYRVIITVVITALILITNKGNLFSQIILENKYILAIGTLSFGLFLWHQVFIAYTRYIFTDDFNTFIILAILITSFALAYISNRLIKTLEHKISLSVILLGTLFVSIFGLYIYMNGGIIKDCPELGYKYTGSIVNLSFKPQENINIKYNMDVYNLDREFEQNGKIKIYVIGNSSSRDWVNVLKCSENSKYYDISYSERLDKKRANQAKYIFILGNDENNLASQIAIDNQDKIWYIGIKHFCLCNGPFYNKPHDEYYYAQRYSIDANIFNKNELLKQKYKDRYIDIIGALIDSNNTIPAFSNENKFISHDGIHLTPAGAKYIFSALQSHYNPSALPFLQVGDDEGDVLVVGGGDVNPHSSGI